MSRDEQRATEARFQHRHDRAARHRLNPFVERSRYAAVLTERLRLRSTEAGGVI